MNTIKNLTISIIISTMIWLYFTWPLALHINETIPASSQMDSQPVRFMLRGDHLQLLYNFELMNHMISGKTPWFYNLYEFNTGNDEERYKPGAYYLPFSLIYSILTRIDGRALAFNITGLFTIWITFLATYLLAKRYCSDPFSALIFSLISIVFPYRWASLMGGSPAGFAMCLIPVLWLGLDYAIRNTSLAGGLLAGIALLFACFTDHHIFFFGALSIPIWIIIAFLAQKSIEWRKLKTYTTILYSLSPLIFFSILSMLYTVLRKKFFAKTILSGTRSFQEVALFSPTWDNFFSWNPNISTYMGFIISIILIVGIVMAWKNVFIQKRDWNTACILSLVVLGTIMSLCLALAVYGPFDGLLFVGIRKLIPPYAMIRQPAKIMCLFPSLLAIGGVIAYQALGIKNKHFSKIFLILIGLLFIIENKHHSHATLCAIDENQPAYQAIVDDASQHNVNAHMLGIPLWPGDSHETSLMQHYAGKYSIRMVNGYSPVVSKDYVQDIFKRFETINIGDLQTEQINYLLDHDIHYLVLHEDAFLSKVSPFAAAYTLKKLLNHPQLELLKNYETVWAFKILSEPKPKKAYFLEWKTFFPARHWEMEKMSQKNSEKIFDSHCSSGNFVRLNKSNSQIEIPYFEAFTTAELQWMLRIRGTANLNIQIDHNESIYQEFEQQIETSGWQWIPISAGYIHGNSHIKLRLFLKDGNIDLDSAFFIFGPWNPLNPNETIQLPAPLFFHSGHTDLETGNLVLTPKLRSEGSVVFFGPKLPFEQGDYRLEIIYTSPAPINTNLGILRIEYGDHLITETKIISQKKQAIDFIIPHNLPLNIVFLYSCTADMNIQNIIITRTK